MPNIPGLFGSTGGDSLPFFLRAEVPLPELGPVEEAQSPKASARCFPAGDKPSGLDASSADSSREETGAIEVSASSKLIFASAAKSISSSIPSINRGERACNQKVKDIVLQHCHRMVYMLSDP